MTIRSRPRGISVNNKCFFIGNIALIAGLLATGCQDSETREHPFEPIPEPGTLAGPLVAGPEQELQVITAKAVAAFREINGAYQAGHVTHDVQVSDGFVEVTPYHVDETGTQIRGGAMALRTASITVDNVSIEGDRRSRINNGVAEVSRGTIVETITNREDGIEQAWRFDSAPPTTGDLTVTVAVVGQQFAANNETGLHFYSPAGLGFRYGDGVWIDATGTRWPIESRYIDGQIVLTVPSDIVANSTFPAILDPTITAEVAIDAPVNGGTGASATLPAIAFDGVNYLVVWADTRLSSRHDIFGTRVSPSGTILDANGITINTGAGSQLNPSATFANGTFVVAWEDFKVAGGTEADIVAARVSTTGIVTQLGTVAGTTANETEPALGGGGTAALLAWTVGATDITGALFNGTTFGAPSPIAASANIEINPAVARNPNGDFLVAWSEGATNVADLRGQLITSAGALNGASFNISAAAGRQNDPTATFDGTNYMLAWTVNSNGINIFGTRISSTGTVLDTHPEGTPSVQVGGVSVTLAANSQERPTIACTSSGCIVLWLEQRNIATTSFDIFAQRVTSTFTLNGGEIIVANPTQPQQAPAVGSDGSNFFGVWQDLRDVQIPTVFGSTISSAGTVGTASSIVKGNNRESAPALGRAGGTNLLAWTDTRGGSSKVDFMRLSIDTTARAVSSGALAQFTPSVSASSATSMYVVWSDSRGGASVDIFATKVNSDGTITNASGIPITQVATDQLVPTVAANQNGTAALVVWQDRRNGNFDIIGALLDANGNVVQADIVICNASGDQTRPAVAFDAVNSQWLVVWSDGRITTDFDIFAARVTTAGVVLDANGIEISGPLAGSQFAPKIATTGGVSLAVWQDRRTDGNGDIFGTRLRGGASLQILDPNSVSYGSTVGGQSAPTVAQNVGAFVVAWQDTRNFGTTKTDIFGIGVSTSGAISEPEFAISATTDDETGPTFGDSSIQKVSRIAYQKERLDLQTIRLVTRTVTVAASTGTSCTLASQCPSGFCVDGKCCDAACGGGVSTDCLACKGELTGQPDGVCSVVNAGRLCRGYADTFCDLEEKCNGIDPTCPSDVGRRFGVSCTIAGGGTGTCPAIDVSGAPHVCQ